MNPCLHPARPAGPESVIFLALVGALAVATNTHAGGSNYGIVPGANPAFAGKVSEWPVPTPKFARDPVIAPDGSIFITVMSGNKMARFDTKTQTFKEWDMPPGHRPHGALVDKNGMVWSTGNGNGTIGKLDPTSGKIVEYKTPSAGGGPHTLVITDNQRTIWFTLQSGDKVASLDTQSDAIKQYAMPGGPYGLALDKAGNVWVCRMGDNKMGRLDPKTGQTSEVDTGRGSRPRRVATAPDGMLWIAYYGNGKLAVLDPAAMKVVKEYALPHGDAGAYAVTVDGAGIVWVNEINTDTVVRFDPKSEQMRVVKLPSSGVGIRKMAVDAQGKLWYVGSHNGRLGVIE